MASCRYLSCVSRYKSKYPIDIQRAKIEKFPEAVCFMRTCYLDDPLIRSMGISVSQREAQRILSALWLALLRSKMSLAALHCNQICALCINCPDTHGGYAQNDILAQLLKIVKTDTSRYLLHSWDKIAREPPIPKGKRIMELAGLAVAREYRRKGIAEILVKSSVKLANHLGFEYIRVDCTNPFAGKICERLGWEKIWEMPFDKFYGVSTKENPLYDKETYKVKVYLQAVKSKSDK